MRVIVLIATLAAVFVVSCLIAGCPAAEDDPGEGVRETIEQALQFIRDGEYEKVWTLYSVEYREKIQAMLETQKKGLRESIAHRRFDVDKWAYAQTHMTAEQYLAASAQEIEAAVLEVRKTDVLKTRIIGKVTVEGDLAYAKIHLPPGDPDSATFVLRNGRWLYHDRTYMPAK